MLLEKIITIYQNKHTKGTNKLRGQNAVFHFKLGGG
jgi:hypothetical protein